MFQRRESEVLIVGAGPVGLFAAIELAERGVDVEIIDSEQRQAARSYALALQPDTLDLLDRRGLLDKLLARGRRVDRLAVYRHGQPYLEIDLSALGTANPYVLVVAQAELESVLGDRLRRAGPEVAWNHRLQGIDQHDEDAVATVQRLVKDSIGYPAATSGWVVDKELRHSCRFLLGADGHDSIVRRRLGVSMQPMGSLVYGVLELEMPAPVTDAACVSFGDGSVDVLWPLAGTRVRWGLQLEAPESVRRRRRKRQFADLGVEQDELAGRLAGLAARRAPFVDTAAGRPVWAERARFDLGLAESFGHGRVWLAGDSAHVAHPLGVHSLNRGLFEAHYLAELFHEILRSNRSMSALPAWSASRRRSWRGFYPDPADTFSTSGSALLPYLPLSADHLTRLAAQIEDRFRQGQVA